MGSKPDKESIWNNCASRWRIWCSDSEWCCFLQSYTYFCINSPLCSWKRPGKGDERTKFQSWEDGIGVNIFGLEVIFTCNKW